MRSTFTFVRNPRDPNDKAPTTVVIDQGCISDRAYSGGTCDNGYGDPLVGDRRGESGQAYSGTFKHHCSLKQNGGAPLDMFYVECTPSATASDSNRGACVRYRAVATKIDLVLTGGIGSTDDKSYLIGQAAGAYVDGLPLSVQSDATHPVWTISGGQPFQSWPATRDIATFNPLPSPLAGTIAPGWFFKDQAPSKGASVTFTGHLVVPAGDSPAGGFDVTLSKQCTVERPAGASLSAYTAQNAGTHALPGPANGVGLYNQPNPSVLGFRGVDISPATVYTSTGTRSSVGIRWDAYVRDPAAYGGGGGWNLVQLVVPNRTQTFHGVSQGLPVNGQGPMLDNSYPYDPGPFDPDNGSPGTYPADGNSYFNGDSPETPILWPDVTHSMADDHFQVWLMYRPPGQDGTFVPIKKLVWNWGGEAAASFNRGLESDLFPKRLVVRRGLPRSSPVVRPTHERHGLDTTCALRQLKKSWTVKSLSSRPQPSRRSSPRTRSRSIAVTWPAQHPRQPPRARMRARCTARP